MLQPIATINLAETVIAGNVPTADGAAIPFLDLLGLASQGLLAALPDDAGEPLLTAVASDDTTQDPLAAAIAMLFQAMGQEPPKLPVLLASGETVTPSLAEDTGTPVVLQKKLPMTAADLAVLRDTLADTVAGDEDMEALQATLERLVVNTGAPTRAPGESTAVVVPGKEQSTDAGQPIATPQALAQVAARAGAETQASTRVQTQVYAPVATPAWQNEIGDRLAWMVGRNAQTAEIILNPPSLGSIEVRLNMNLAGNEAGAQFFSANSNVREALESAFPRLRELMAGVGINLGQTSVSQESFAGRESFADSGRGWSEGDEAVSETAYAGIRPVYSTGRNAGLVDLYV